MGYGGTPNTKLPLEFGNGSDGDLHVQADAYITSPELQLTSLEVDAGFELKVKEWWLSPYLTVVNIRCQTPVILNGKITANGVTAYVDGGNNGIYRTAGRVQAGDSYRATEFGQTPAVYYDMGSGEGGVPANIFPICGGWAAGSLFTGYYPTHLPTPYMAVPYGNNPPSSFMLTDANFADFAGPGRQFRYAAGAGGSGDTASSDKAGGDGGGIICIYAPQIIFGASGGIEAKGTEGQAGLDANSGGGGGGYIETWTRVPLTDLEKTRCVVTGGAAGGVSGYAGLDGVRHFIEI